MPLPVWLSLCFLILALTAGALYVFRAARAFWREMKSFTAAVDGTTAALAAALERLAARSAAFGSGLPTLDAAIARLRASQRRLAVLRAALKDVTDSVGRVTAVYPRK